MPGCTCIQWFLSRSGCVKQQSKQGQNIDDETEVIKVISNGNHATIVSGHQDITPGCYDNQGFQMVGATCGTIQVNEDNGLKLCTSTELTQGHSNFAFEEEIEQETGVHQQVEAVLSVNQLNQENEIDVGVANKSHIHPHHYENESNSLDTRARQTLMTENDETEANPISVPQMQIRNVSPEIFYDSTQDINVDENDEDRSSCEENTEECFLNDMNCEYNVSTVDNVSHISIDLGTLTGESLLDLHQQCLTDSSIDAEELENVSHLSLKIDNTNVNIDDAKETGLSPKLIDGIQFFEKDCNLPQLTEHANHNGSNDIKLTEIVDDILEDILESIFIPRTTNQESVDNAQNDDADDTCEDAKDENSCNISDGEVELPLRESPQFNKMILLQDEEDILYMNIYGTESKEFDESEEEDLTVTPESEPEGQREKLSDWIMSNDVDSIDDWLQNSDAKERNAIWNDFVDGQSLVMMVAQLGKTDILSQLHKSGVPLNKIDEDINFPIHAALSKMQTSAVVFLSSLGHCKLKNRDGESVLHLITKMGDIFLLEEILNHVDVNIQTANGWSALHLAVSEGYQLIVERLLQIDNIDLNIQTDNCKSSLAIAIEKEFTEITKLLLENGASPDIIDQFDEENIEVHPLFGPGDTAMASLMLQYGADPNKRTMSKRAPLHYAALRGRDRMVRLLVEHGASLDDQDKDGTTPLLLSAREGHRLVMINLLELGADANISDKEGVSPLFECCLRGNALMVEKLVNEIHAQVNIPIASGTSLLHVAARNGYTDIIALLLAANADVSAKDSEGKTPLHYACKEGHLTVVVQLEFASADPDVEDAHGITPLMAAASQRATEVVQYLVTKSKKSYPLYMHACNPNVTQQDLYFLKLHGVNLDKQDQDGHTPLHHALKNRNRAVAITLIKIKVCLNLKDKEGNTALHLAAVAGLDDIVDLMAKDGALSVPNENGEAPLCLAVRYNHNHAIEALLRNGAAADTKMKDGKTVIFSAVENNQSLIVKLLIRYGANVNYACSGTMQRPLHIAAKYGHKNILTTLLDHRASVNHEEFITQKTALHLAAEEGHQEAVCVLLRACANVNVLTILEEKPLHLAARNGHINVVDTLIRAGTQVELVDQYNNVVYDLAKHAAVWNLLKKWSSQDPTRVSSTPQHNMNMIRSLHNIVRGTAFEQFLHDITR